ncbi:hypothetical protein [Pseudolactococcus hodotermopsidis]|nr:hypothetical protein [Lactococcus hodotermopsidis]
MTEQHLSINEVMDSDWRSLLMVLGAGDEVAKSENKVIDLADFINTL